MAKTGQVMKDEGVKIMLDKERTLKFDLNTLCELEDSDMGLEDIFEGLSERSFKKIRTILHAVLAHEEDESFTVKRVGSLIPVDKITDVADALTRALSNSVPESDEDEQGNATGK